MKTKKILAFVLAALMMVGVISAPTQVSAATDVDFSLRVTDGAVDGEITIWLEGTIADNGVPATLPSGTVTWDQTGETWSANSGKHFINFAHDFSTDLTFEVTFTPDDTTTDNVTTKKFTLFSDAKLNTIPTLNDGNISAELLSAAAANDLEVIELVLDDIRRVDEEMYFSLLAAYSTFLNNQPQTMGTLAVFVSITPDITVGPDENFRLNVPGLNEGTPVTVLNLGGDQSITSLDATVGDGYIDMTTSFDTLIPGDGSLFMVFVDETEADIDVPATGDDTNIMLYTIIGMMAVAGISFVALRKRVND